MSDAVIRPQQPVLSDFSGQGVLYDGLIRTLRDGNFVHAYLIGGMAGVGKRTLAMLIAQHLLCSGQTKPCGECPSCVQVRESNHPDVHVIAPGKPLCPDVKPGLQGIPVAEIRYAISLVGQHTFSGGYRAVVIEQAEKMNPAAQNALLKTLEEPVDGTIFLLLSDSPELLLPTIISRCRSLKLHPWPEEDVIRVLRQQGIEDRLARQAARASGGSMGRAVSIAADEKFWLRRNDVMHDFLDISSRSDILTVSTAWKDRKGEAEELLDDLEDMIRTLMLVRLERLPEDQLTSYPEAWKQMADSAPLKSFIELLDAVAEARKLRGNQVTWQAVVEKLLLRLMEEKNKWSR